MKAARYYTAKDIRVEEIPIPCISKKQIKIEVKCVGICGTDVHEYLHGPLLIPMKEPYPLNGHCGVTTLGHEISGVVVEIGDDVRSDRIKIGDRVVVEPLFRNPHDHFTVKGEYNLSEPFGGIGLMGNGGLAKYIVVEDYMVHKIPDNVSFEQGALVEPAAVAVHAIKMSNLQIGETCVIFGAGPIGLLCVQAAMAAGASRTVVVSRAGKRLEKARELGATAVLNANDDDILQQIKAHTGDLGADVFIDAAGAQTTVTNGIASLRKGGRAVLVAVYTEPMTLNLMELVIREITIKGSIGYRHIFPQVIELIAEKKLNVEQLITRKIKLDDIVKDGFDALAYDRSEVKILVQIDAN